jgi:PAS domain S-box-containing protein
MDRQLQTFPKVSSVTTDPSGTRFNASREGDAMITDTALGDAVLVLDQNGRVLQANGHAEAIFGRPSLEIVGLSERELFGIPAGPLAVGASQSGERVLNRGAGYSVVIEYSLISVDIGPSPLRLAILRDITARKSAERVHEARARVTELLAGADSVREVISQVLETICLNLGWDVGELWWLKEEGDGLRRLENWHRPELDLKKFGRFGTEWMTSEFMGLPDRAFSSRQLVCVDGDSDYTGIGVAEGEQPDRLCSAIAFPILVDGGVHGVIQVLAFHRRRRGEHESRFLQDLGELIGQLVERKEAQQEASERLRLMRELIDSTEAAIYAKSREGRYLLLNRRAVDILHLDRDYAIGKTDFELFPEKFAALLSKVDQSVWDQDEDIELEELVPFEDGPHTFLSLKFLLRDATRKPYALCGISTDVTRMKDLENRLRDAQRLEAIGQLAAGVAHEINTPTQYVSDNTRFLEDAFRDLTVFTRKSKELIAAVQKGVVSPELTQEVVSTMERADVDFLQEEIPLALRQSLDGLERVATIVRAMKEFSHPGKEKTLVDLNRSIESTITVTRNEWKYVADVVTDFDASLPLVFCTPTDFNQAILNMIVNAAHAIGDVGNGSENKGVITIRTRSVGEWVEVTVEDTGVGIPEENQSKVFEPFFTTKEVGRGTGQGLSIVHRVVTRQHGGTISLTSEVGRGTTFVVRLPLAVSKVLAEAPR